jgi:hypothetical protein
MIAAGLVLAAILRGPEPTKRRVRFDDAALAPRGTTILVWGVLGAAIGAVTVFGDVFSWTDHHQRFVHKGEFIVWFGLIVVQTTAWAIGLQLVREIRRGLRRADRRIAFAVVVMAIFVGLGVLAGAFVPAHYHWHSYGYLEHRRWKIAILGVFGAAVALYGFETMWKIYRELDKRRREPVGPLDEEIPRYLWLHDRLQQLIVLLGGAVGLATLAAGAERRVVGKWFECDATPFQSFLGADHCRPLNFPAEYVLLYGFYFTTLLALAYGPVHLTLMAVGRRLRAVALADVPVTDIETWQSKRSALNAVLDLDIATATSFRAALAILTPLIASLTGLLFGSGA